MQSIFDTLSNMFTAKISASRNFYAEIPSTSTAGCTEPGLTGEEFLPGECYFSVRLVEMRLAQKTNFIFDFLPLCLFFLRYNEAGYQREIPYIVGHDLIKSTLGAQTSLSGANRVHFQDVYIARNIPFNAGGVEMFAALCRLSDSTVTRGILDFVATTLSILGGPTSGAILTAGKGVLEPIGKLFGADGVDLRFGTFHGNVLRRSGYRILAASDTQNKLHDVQLIDGVLHRVRSHGTKETVDDVDYVVLAFEHQPTLGKNIFNAATALPFHKKWREVTSAIAVQDKVTAKALFKSLILEVDGSPLLTEMDRFALIAAYQVEKERRMASGNISRAPGTGDVLSSISDRRNVAKRENRAAAIPLEAARISMTKSLSVSLNPNVDSLERTFSTVEKSLRSNKSIGTLKGKSANANALPDVFSDATRELLSVALNDTI